MYNKPVFKAGESELPDNTRWPCWSAYSRVYIDVNGNVYPCTIGNDCYRENSALNIGNVHKDTLIKIFNDAPVASARTRAEQNEEMFPECAACNVWQLLPNNFSYENGCWKQSANQARLHTMKD